MADPSLDSPASFRLVAAAAAMVGSLALVALGVQIGTDGLGSGGPDRNPGTEAASPAAAVVDLPRMRPESGLDQTLLSLLPLPAATDVGSTSGAPFAPASGSTGTGSTGAPAGPPPPDPGPAPDPTTPVPVPAPTPPPPPVLPADPSPLLEPLEPILDPVVETVVEPITGGSDGGQTEQPLTSSLLSTLTVLLGL